MSKSPMQKINQYEFQISQNSKRIEELKKDIKKLKGEIMSKKQTNSRHWSARPGKMERIIYNEIISNEERRAYAQQMLHMEAHTYWLKYRNEQLEQQLAEADKAVDRISIVSYIGVGVLSGLLLLMTILASM